MHLCNAKRVGKPLPSSLLENIKHEVSSLVDIINSPSMRYPFPAATIKAHSDDDGYSDHTYYNSPRGSSQNDAPNASDDHRNTSRSKKRDFLSKLGLGVSGSHPTSLHHLLIRTPDKADFTRRP
jgi:hypothetical protein